MCAQACWDTILPREMGNGGSCHGRCGLCRQRPNVGPNGRFGRSGFGIIGAWGFVGESSVGSGDVGPLWLWPSSLAYAAVLLAFAFAHRACERILPFKGLAIAGGVAGVLAAFVLSGALLSAADSPFVVASAGVLMGIARGVAGLFWIVSFVRLGERDLLRLFGLSMVANSFVALLAHAISEPLPLTAVLAFLPAASSALLLKCRPVFAAMCGPDAGKEASGAWTFPFKPVAMLVVYTFVVHLGTALVPSTGFASVSLGNVLAGILLLAFATLLWSRFQIGMIYRASLPIVLASMLLCLFPDVASAVFGVGFFGGFGFSCFLAFANVVLCVICHRFGISPLWIFGMTMAVRIPAKLVAEEVAGMAAVDSGMLVPTVVIAALALVSFSMACASGEDYESSWGMRPLDRPSSDVETPYKAFLNRCAELSRERNLTHREEEVLTLLAQGMNVPGIERTLVVSKNTAKSHARNLYGKLGVHSRDELLDAVGREHVLIAERYRDGSERPGEDSVI